MSSQIQIQAVSVETLAQAYEQEEFIEKTLVMNLPITRFKDTSGNEKIFIDLAANHLIQISNA